MDLSIDAFDFALPEALIAQRPLAQRSASRLLHLDASGTHHDRRFVDLPALLQPGDLLVVNDTRVINARLHGHKASGGRIEALVERIDTPHRAWAQVRASHPPRPGSRLWFGPAAPAVVTAGAGVHATVAGRDGDLFELHFDDPVDAVLERCGALPLPPYIAHAPDDEDRGRYQTVYAARPGAVAAPTAGLHFTPALLEALAARGVRQACITLHVGAGTFQPVRVQRLAEHRMHRERYDVPAATAAAIAETRAAGGRIVAVGTTTLRTLEAVAEANGGRVVAGHGDTALFVRPGFAFRVVDRLVTNFHLPRSTLLVLVSAFAGVERIRAAYAHAIAQRYRFFSYGDAMLLERPR